MENKSIATWVKVDVRTWPGYLESLSAFIFALDAEGLKEDENGFTVYFDSKKWSPEKFHLLLRELQIIIPDFDESRMEIGGQQEEDWLEGWKKNLKPFHITKNLVVQPDWENYQPKQDEIEITIAPKMAFGTGHHESTQLSLILMEEFLKPGVKFLDVGTGSGILSIYAAKKGAAFIVGIDNDSISIENAKENAALNGVQTKIIFKIEDAHRLNDTGFDLVVANMDRNILMEIAKDLQNALQENGTLILSGILVRDRELLIEEMERFHLKLIAEKTKNEWIGLVFKKKVVFE